MGLAVRAVEGQREAGRFAAARVRRVELGDELRPADGIAEPRVVVVRVAQGRRVTAGEARLADELVEAVLVGRDEPGLVHAESGCDHLGERACVVDGGGAGAARVGQESRVAPERLSVGAPVHADGPARQWLARVPLALGVAQERALGEAVGELAGELGGQPVLRGSVRIRVPFGGIHVGSRDERRLAAHREAHVGGAQAQVDGAAEVEHACPLLVRVRLRHPRRLVDPRDRVLEREVGLEIVGGFDRALDRGGGRRLGRAGERDVPLAREEAGGGVEADPTCAGHVRLRPCVQIGEVLGEEPRRRIDGRAVGGELQEVAGGEAGRDAEVAEHVHE
ncbi:MAG: hypothetical protein PGN13_15265 [Patulibacter minatonensis]